MGEADHPINSNTWAQAYPAPSDRSEKSPLAGISVQELSERIDAGAKPGKDLLVVDVRRADCLSMIPGAINLPAHSLPVSLPSLIQLLSNIPLVVFHCNRSNGRGPRAAGWYADALQKHLNLSDDEVSQRVQVLTGGIVAWEEQFGAGSLEQRGVQLQEGKKNSVQL